MNALVDTIAILSANRLVSELVCQRHVHQAQQSMTQTQGYQVHSGVTKVGVTRSDSHGVAVFFLSKKLTTFFSRRN